jgi:hypothetical protein
MEINVQITGGTYRTVISPRPHARLSSAWQTFQYLVKARGVDIQGQHQIAFFLGNRVGTVWLSDVQMQKVSR